MMMILSVMCTSSCFRDRNRSDSHFDPFAVRHIRGSSYSQFVLIVVRAMQVHNEVELLYLFAMCNLTY